MPLLSTNYMGAGINPSYAVNPRVDTGTTGVNPVDANFAKVIDGTPVRVVVLALSAAAGLTALRMAGFKFNVGVSTR